MQWKIAFRQVYQVIFGSTPPWDKPSSHLFLGWIKLKLTKWMRLKIQISSQLWGWSNLDISWNPSKFSQQVCNCLERFSVSAWLPPAASFLNHCTIPINLILMLEVSIKQHIGFQNHISFSILTGNKKKNYFHYNRKFLAILINLKKKKNQLKN